METHCKWALRRLAEFGIRKYASPACVSGISFALLTLDALFGISVLNALIDLDIHTDAAVDMTEASFAIARSSNNVNGIGLRGFSSAYTDRISGSLSEPHGNRELTMSYPR